jgi:hypothetical protein
MNKPDRLFLKKEILREWSGSENSSLIEAKDTKMSARNHPNIFTDPYGSDQE